MYGIVPFSDTIDNIIHLIYYEIISDGYWLRTHEHGILSAVGSSGIQQLVYIPRVANAP